MAELLKQAYDTTIESPIFQQNLNNRTELFIEEQQGNVLYNSFKNDIHKDGCTSINENVFSNYTVNSVLTEDVAMKERELLLCNLKKEAKKIMEEAITCKYINESSGNVISLCGAVESCLQFGLRRGRLGIFRLNSTGALLAKVAKTYPLAQIVIDKMRIQASVKHNTHTKKRNDANCGGGKAIMSLQEEKYLWIRVALLEKSLADIVEHLVANGDKYYERDSIVADACDGPILASLLVGPCAMDFLSSSTESTSSNHMLMANKKSATSNITLDSDSTSCSSAAIGEQIRSSEKKNGNGSMELLHHDMKSILLFGKNNVLVQHQSELVEPFRTPGYLSLSHLIAGLFVTWTPNDLVKSESSAASTVSGHSSRTLRDRVISINVQDIVYVHCHQISGCGGTAVFIAHSGLQYPPFHFPAGDHLLAFLTCLENGLLPHGQLDPPLWLQRAKFRKKHRVDAVGPEDDSDEVDHVFRIIYTTPSSRTKSTNEENGTEELETLSPVFAWHPSFTAHADQQKELKKRNSETTCDVIPDPLISQMFYGWLNYCRYMKSLRAYLGDLIHMDASWWASGTASANHDCLTEVTWRSLLLDGRYHDICQLVFRGGCAPEIRHEVWPYLLGHYDWTSDEQTRRELDEKVRQSYHSSLSQWLAAEKLATQKVLAEDVSNEPKDRLNIPPDNNTHSTGHSLSTTTFVIDDASHTQSQHQFKFKESGNVESCSTDMLDVIMLNIQRIDDDLSVSCHVNCVDRQKLRNIICACVWQNLAMGYVQGFFDLVTLLLDMLQDEAMTFACFQRCINQTTTQHSSTMDHLFANMRALLQLLDPQLFEQMQNRRRDYTHFNFCRRWFLYRFKKELGNDADVCYLWEVIWAARHIVTDNFELFCALALLVKYREQIMHNNMDFCAIMKFYNDMAKRHCVRGLVETSRNLVLRLHSLLNRK